MAHLTRPASCDRRKLANGWLVVVQPEPETALVCLHASYPAGSRFDPEGREGLAHLCEHLADSATLQSSGSTLPEAVEATGGTSQATTRIDRAEFCTVLPGPFLELGFQLETARLARCSNEVLPQELDRQRAVLLQELRQRQAHRFHETAFRTLFAQLFPAPHPYHRLPAGKPETISQIAPIDCSGFLAGCYRPEGAVLTVCGACEPDATCELAARYLGAVPQRRGPREQREAPQPRASAGLAGSRTPSEPERPSRCYVAFLAPPFATPGWWATTLLMRLLALPEESLLKSLGDTVGWKGKIEPFLVGLEEAGVVLFAFSADSGRSEAMGQEVVRSLGARLADGPLPPKVMGSARRKALREHLNRLDRLDERATFLAQSAVQSVSGAPESEAGDWRDPFTALDEEFLRTTARAVFQPGAHLGFRD